MTWRVNARDRRGCAPRISGGNAISDNPVIRRRARIADVPLRSGRHHRWSSQRFHPAQVAAVKGAGLHSVTKLASLCLRSRRMLVVAPEASS
jgi:hypothetical protein